MMDEPVVFIFGLPIKPYKMVSMTYPQLMTEVAHLGEEELLDLLALITDQLRHRHTLTSFSQHMPAIPTVRPSAFLAVSGLLDIDGDALKDTEALYS